MAATDTGSDLGIESGLFKAADKLRGNMEPSDYKHVALGLIFLKHISDGFEAKRAELLAEYPEGAEDPDEYLADNIFWVPPEARWSHLQASAKQPSIGKLIDEAMIAIEKVNPSLKGVLPKDYGRPALNAVMLGELIDLIGTSYRNPVDVSSANPPLDTIERILDILLRDPLVDAVMLELPSSLPSNPSLKGSSYLDKLLSILSKHQETSSKPFFVTIIPFDREMEGVALRNMLTAQGIPSFPSFQKGANAYLKVLEYYQYKESSDQDK